jgi:hypothetical protein
VQRAIITPGINHSFFGTSFRNCRDDGDGYVDRVSNPLNLGITNDPRCCLIFLECIIDFDAKLKLSILLLVSFARFGATNLTCEC